VGSCRGDESALRGSSARSYFCAQKINSSLTKCSREGKNAEVLEKERSQHNTGREIFLEAGDCHPRNNRKGPEGSRAKRGRRGERREQEG